MENTESYTYSEEQIDYWARVHDHLGLGRHGIPLDFFLADPFLHLRRIGTGEMAGMRLSLLDIYPATGPAC
jgi:hypothetical protein